MSDAAAASTPAPAKKTAAIPRTRSRRCHPYVRVAQRREDNESGEDLDTTSPPCPVTSADSPEGCSQPGPRCSSPLPRPCNPFPLHNCQEQQWDLMSPVSNKSDDFAQLSWTSGDNSDTDSSYTEDSINADPEVATDPNPEADAEWERRRKLFIQRLLCDLPNKGVEWFVRNVRII